MEYAHKKWGSLQKEIDNRGIEIETTKRRKQRELLMAWRDAEDYIRKDKPNIKYSRKPIIGMDKQTRTYRTSRRGKQVETTIAEYTDWDHGQTFTENQ